MPAFSQQNVAHVNSKILRASRPETPQYLNMIKKQKSGGRHVRQDFARRLSVAREQSGYRFKKKFSEALGVEAETYNGWERGRTEPSLHYLAEISRLTNTSLDFLVSGQPVNRYPGIDEK